MTFKHGSGISQSRDVCESRLKLINRLYQQQLVLTKKVKTNVYFGQHADFGEVVIKFAATQTEKTLLQREATFLHDAPSVWWSKWRDYQSLSGTDCLILEKIPGDPLTTTATLTPPSLQWLQGIEHALITLHQRGIIHGDIKPSNIMVSANGEGKLIDFSARQFIGKTPQTPIAKSRFFYDTQTNQICNAKQDWQALAITVAINLHVDPFHSLPLSQAKLMALQPNTKGIPSKYALLLKQALC